MLDFVAIFILDSVSRYKCLTFLFIIFYPFVFMACWIVMWLYIISVMFNRKYLRGRRMFMNTPPEDFDEGYFEIEGTCGSGQNDIFTFCGRFSF